MSGQQHGQSVSTIQQRFERLAAENPSAPAIVHDGATLSYGELERQANWLAHHFVEHGLRPGEVIALLLERSPAVVVAMLAVLKAGGCFVALDPAYPRERLATMLADACPKMLVTSDLLSDVAPAGVPILDLDARAASIERQRSEPPELNIAAGSVAYLVYTSGSTGVPKAILGTHGGVTHYLRYILETVGLSADARVLNIASISFDACLREIFAPLSIGACLIIPTQQQARDPRALLKIMRDQRVSAVLCVVPSLLKEILRAASALRCSLPPHLFLVSGEPLYYRTVTELRRLSSLPLRVINQYGPSETTMTTSYFEVGSCDDDALAVPIGRAIPGTALHVLDAHMKPVAAGVTGEIHVGGNGVTLGYLASPAHTAERFLADPFSAAPGARLYRTGDLARYGTDGHLEFLGRNDRQVKVRGVRVDPAEVQAVLYSCEDVADALVIARGDGTDGTQLVAYVVPRAGAVMAVGELRAQLARKLPEHLLPGGFVILSAFPLTPNGKLDRHALPNPDAEVFSRPPYVPPAGDIESTLACAWQQVLCMERIGRDDNFFHLGGHSLRAIQLIARIEESLGVPIPLHALVQNPTIHALAACIERDLAERASTASISAEDGVI